jgi:hypothetical protein
MKLTGRQPSLSRLDREAGRVPSSYPGRSSGRFLASLPVSIPVD